METRNPSRFSTNIDSVLAAAFEGRVSHLYLQEGVRHPGTCDRGAYHGWGNEDLLNIAAVQTLIHHGSTCELPGGVMPEGAIAAAVLRY
jgi:hypothetical protein